MPKTKKREQWECPGCHEPICPDNNLRRGDIYVCPNCQIHWKVLKITDIWMKMEKLIPTHTCSNAPNYAVRYYDAEDENEYDLPFGSGWHFITESPDEDRTLLLRVYYCPFCGKKLDPDSSIPAQRLEINRVLALELE
jgi:hypothetical protein